jgi:hypothetical protein
MGDPCLLIRNNTGFQEHMTEQNFLKNTVRFSYFITPHGFGHAARACAVMNAIYNINPDSRFEIFTSVPRFFFDESLPTGIFNVHHMTTDIGLAQKSALLSDIPETVRLLNGFLPFDHALIEQLADQLKALGCERVICDIAPLGIKVAAAAGIPSVLIENFTWDWIYEQYSVEVPSINRHIDYLRKTFTSADYHIQAEPVCFKQEGLPTTSPISRKPVNNRHQIRTQLGIPQEAKVVMISMGGVPEELSFNGRLHEHEDVYFLIPGSPANTHKGNVITLTHDSKYYHPDLIHASDALLGKPGYSTLAEVFQSGITFASVSRPSFRESSVMEKFIQEKMNGLLIGEKEFHSGDWLDRLSQILELTSQRPTGPNGADQAAKIILDRL